MTVNSEQVKTKQSETSKPGAFARLSVSYVALTFQTPHDMVVVWPNGYRNDQLVLDACEEIKEIDGVSNAYPLGGRSIAVKVVDDTDHGDVLKDLRYKSGTAKPFGGIGRLCRHVTVKDDEDDGTASYHATITLDAKLDPGQRRTLEAELAKGMTGLRDSRVSDTTISLFFDSLYGRGEPSTIRALRSIAANLGVRLLDDPVVDQIVQMPALTVGTLTFPGGLSMTIIYGAAVEESAKSTS